MRRGSSAFPDATFPARAALSDENVAERPKMMGRMESLMATVDESDFAKERPPSARGRAKKTAKAATPPPAPAPSTATPAPSEPTTAAVDGGSAADPLARYANTTVVMHTSMTRDQLATVATRKIVTQLVGLGVEFVQLDGMDPENKEVRKALWSKADAKPGTYPILYVGATGYTCKGEEVQDLIDGGELAKVLGVATPRRSISAPPPAPPPPAPATAAPSQVSKPEAPPPPSAAPTPVPATTSSSMPPPRMLA